MLEFLKMKVVLKINLDIFRILKRSNLKIISIYLIIWKNKQKLRRKGDFLCNFNI